MTTRYCASCDLVGRGPYTEWKGEGGMDPAEYCDTDYGAEPHPLHVVEWKYAFHMDDQTACNCMTAYPFDDGVECCRPLPIYFDLWRHLVNAMEREAAAGTFEFEMWYDTFPRRANELLERSLATVTAALADELPAVLVEIVCAFVC